MKCKHCKKEINPDERVAYHVTCGRIISDTSEQRQIAEKLLGRLNSSKNCLDRYAKKLEPTHEKDQSSPYPKLKKLIDDIEKVTREADKFGLVANND